MRKISFLLITVTCLAMIAMSAAPVTAASLKPLRLSLQPSPEAYIVWRIINKGLDKKAGLAFEMLYFDSGSSQFEAFPADAWDIAMTGSPPFLTAILRYPIQLIGLSCDDGVNNMILVRPGDPILKDKGKESKYPDIYGSADAIKGRTLLVPVATSAHYAVSGWLHAFGLADEDVVIQNMGPGQVVAAFESGVGDVMCVWVPFALTGIAKGWKLAGDGSLVDASAPLVWVSGTEYNKNNPETVKTFLKLYYDEVDLYFKELAANKKAVAEDAQQMFKNWAGMDMTVDDIALMLRYYKLYTYDENKNLFAGCQDSQAANLIKKVGDFFARNQRITAEERDKISATPFVNCSFFE